MADDRTWLTLGNRPALGSSRLKYCCRAFCKFCLVLTACSDCLRLLVWELAGSFPWNLMALPLNAFWLPDLARLPFFSPFPVAGSADVNVFLIARRMVLYNVILLLSCFLPWSAFCANGAMFVSFSFFLFSTFLTPSSCSFCSEPSFSCFGFRSKCSCFLSPNGFQLSNSPLGFDSFALCCRFPPRSSFCSPSPFIPVCVDCFYVSTSIPL